MPIATGFGNQWDVNQSQVPPNQNGESNIAPSYPNGIPIAPDGSGTLSTWLNYNTLNELPMSILSLAGAAPTLNQTVITATELAQSLPQSTEATGLFSFWYNPVNAVFPATIFSTYQGATHFQVPTVLQFPNGLGVDDSPQGTLSVWTKTSYPQAIPPTPPESPPFGDYILLSVQGGSGSDPDSTSSSEFIIGNGSGSPYFDDTNVNTSLTLDVPSESLQGTWTHILISWDFSGGEGHRTYQMCVNGTLVTPATITSDNITNTNIYYDGVINLFGNVDSSGNMTDAFVTIVQSPDNSKNFADVSDFWFDPGTYMDLTNPANVEKFIITLSNEAFYPANLGSNGSGPTGSPPAIFLSGNAENFIVNQGTAGDPVVVGGPLMDATTSPYEMIDLSVDIGGELIFSAFQNTITSRPSDSFFLTSNGLPSLLDNSIIKSAGTPGNNANTNGWVNIIVSWNLSGTQSSSGSVTIIVNGINLGSVGISSNLSFHQNILVDYNQAFTFFGQSAQFGGSGFQNYWSGDVAEFWLGPNQNSSLLPEKSYFGNYDQVQERYDNSPTWLDFDGTNVTNVQPLVYLSGDHTLFSTNRGNGGPVTIVGALTNATTAPWDTGFAIPPMLPYYVPALKIYINGLAPGPDPMHVGTNSIIFQIQSDNGYVYVTDGELPTFGWHNIMVSWDTSVPVYQIFVDGQNTNPDIFDGQINTILIPYNRLIQLFHLHDQTDKIQNIFSGSLAEFWFAPGVFLDFTQPQNIKSFIGQTFLSNPMFTGPGGIGPVYLGSEGQLPLNGTPPAIYFSTRPGGSLAFIHNRNVVIGDPLYYLDTEGNVVVPTQPASPNTWLNWAPSEGNPSLWWPMAGAIP